MPDLGGLPHHLVDPIQRRLEVVEHLLEREERLRRELAGHAVAPFDAMFDLLADTGATLARQAEALEAAGRALEETAALVKHQADLFEQTIGALRRPVDLAKAAAGVERAAGRPVSSASGPE
jgi:hypothetical protein